MQIAMGLTAILCVAIGVYSPWLYSLLPNDVVYEPYTLSHVINQLQTLIFSALAFAADTVQAYPPG